MEIAFAPHHHAVPGRVHAHHVEGLAGGDPEAPALAHRVMDGAAMLPQRPPGQVHDLPRAGLGGALGPRAHELPVMAALDEADVLALDLLRHPEPGPPGGGPGLGLGPPPRGNRLDARSSRESPHRT